MFRLQGCPKCGKGDQVLEQDRWSRDLVCIQCGHREALRPFSQPTGRRARTPTTGVEPRRALRVA